MRMGDSAFLKPGVWFVERYLNFKGTPIFAIILSAFDLYLILEKADLAPPFPGEEAPFLAV